MSCKLENVVADGVVCGDAILTDDGAIVGTGWREVTLEQFFCDCGGYFSEEELKKHLVLDKEFKMFNFSYSSIADVYAIAEKENRPDIREFGLELERMGIASLEDTVYMYRNTLYGMEIISMEDLASEEEDDDDYDD